MPQIAALILVLLMDSLVAHNFFAVHVQEGSLFGSPIDILNRAAPVALLAIGMTLVIATGGIDLSVGAVIAFSGVLLARIIGDYHVDPRLAFALVLAMGVLFGAIMGWLIDALKIPAFIITLAGVFFLRGCSYLVSENSIPIDNPLYTTLSNMTWKVPGGRTAELAGLDYAGGVCAAVYCLRHLSSLCPALACSLI